MLGLQGTEVPTECTGPFRRRVRSVEIVTERRARRSCALGRGSSWQQHDDVIAEVAVVADTIGDSASRERWDMSKL